MPSSNEIDDSASDGASAASNAGPIEKMQSQDTLFNKNLTMQVEIPEWKHSLEREKLKYEIEELRDSPRRMRRATLLTWVTATLSTLTTLVVAIVGGYVTWQVQLFVARQHDSERYTELLKDLGSENPNARVGAVVGLIPFVETGQERRAHTITILIGRLSSEDSVDVIRVLIPTIVSIGHPALDDLVRANRSAARKFLTAAQALVATSMPPLESYATNRPEIGRRGFRVKLDAGRGFGEIEYALASKLTYDLLNEQEKDSLKASAHGIFHGKDPIINPFYLFAAEEDETFGLSRNLMSGVPSNGELKSIETRNRHEKLLSDAVDGGRQLFVTSLTLGRVLRKLSGTLTGSDLSGITLLAADLSQVSLSETDLSGSFIAGIGTGANLTRTKLIGARFSAFDLPSANISFASLDGMWLPNTTFGSLHSRDWRVTYLGTANLTGSNWWDSENVKKHSSSAQFETLRHKKTIFKLTIDFQNDEEDPEVERENLEEAFPRADNEKKFKERFVGYRMDQSKSSNAVITPAAIAPPRRR